MSGLLEVRLLAASYGPTKVLHGIDFGLDAGGIATILGANGAGKTSTLRALSGLIRRSGEIRFQGDRIDGCATEDIARRGIAHVPDGRGTFVDLTVEGSPPDIGAIVAFTTLVTTWLDHAGVPFMVARVATACCVGLFTYVGARLWVFRKEPAQD